MIEKLLISSDGSCCASYLTNKYDVKCNASFIKLLTFPGVSNYMSCMFDFMSEQESSSEEGERERRVDGW